MASAGTAPRMTRSPSTDLSPRSSPSEVPFGLSPHRGLAARSGEILVARRIPLPRLTQRQREARWQRERRQQTIIIVVFTVLLCSAMGLMVWAGTNRYYNDNLKPAAMIDGHGLPYRLY